MTNAEHEWRLPEVVHDTPSYRFTILPYVDRSTLPNSGGVYIYARRLSLLSPCRWEAIYIGESVNIRKRANNNRKRNEAFQEMGATHIHYRVFNLSEDWQYVEKLLIYVYAPPLNEKSTTTLPSPRRLQAE